MSLLPPTLESDRLRFQAIRPSTFDPLEMYEHVNPEAPRIEEITRYLTWSPHATPKITAEFVEQAGQEFESDEGVHYAIYPTDGSHEGEFVGTSGLHLHWDRRLATMGIWLRPVVWGNGYSGERAARMFELAFDRLDLDVVAVEHDTRNEKSQRAIERYVDRFGGRCEGTRRNGAATNNGAVYDVVRYSVTAEEWAEHRDN